MKTASKLMVSVLSIVIATQCAGAWSLFGSSTSNAAGRLKSADRILEKADASFDEGDIEAAGKGYSRAMEKYQVIARDYPEFEDGIAAIRADYCASQLVECGMTPAGNDIEPGSTGTSAGAEASPALAPTPNPANDDSAAAAFRAATGEPPPPAADEKDAPPEEPAAPYNPRYLTYDFSEARDLIESGRHADAIDILVPIVNFDPENRQLRMLLAAAHLGAGQPELAITALEDLRGRREDFPLLLLISAAYTSAGRFPDALLALDAAAKLSPGEPDPYSNLAWLTLLMDGETPESRALAEGYYNQALRRGAARDPTLEGVIDPRGSQSAVIDGRQ